MNDEWDPKELRGRTRDILDPPVVAATPPKRRVYYLGEWDKRLATGPCTAAQAAKLTECGLRSNVSKNVATMLLRELGSNGWKPLPATLQKYGLPGAK